MPVWCADCDNYVHGGIIAEVFMLQISAEPNPPPSYHSERPEQQLENKSENYDVPASDKVFVIMAGEQKPSCLAKLVASTTQPCEQV
ncbi:hypothetical protein CRYUN_Cryun12cG0163300 [Craigia yunnanensis]